MRVCVARRLLRLFQAAQALRALKRIAAFLDRETTPHAAAERPSARALARAAFRKEPAVKGLALRRSERLIAPVGSAARDTVVLSVTGAAFVVGDGVEVAQPSAAASDGSAAAAHAATAKSSSSGSSGSSGGGGGGSKGSDKGSDAMRGGGSGGDGTFDRGGTFTVRGVDLEVRRGELVCVVGPVASGKSTLLVCAQALGTWVPQ